MTKMTRLCGLRPWLSLLALMVSASALAVDPPAGSWRHAVGRQHPLVGGVWDVEHGKWVDLDALVRRLGTTKYVLLGEKHDNADHHRLQAWLVASLASSKRRPAVAFEMLEMDDQSVIDRQLKEAPTDAAGLAAAVRWDEQGWPDWQLYEPIFEAALTKGLPILATNLSRASTRELVNKGSSVLGSDLVHEFGLDEPLGPEMHQRLIEELKSSHCGHASPKTIEKMILVQRARDAQMARQLTKVYGNDGGILMAGAFHVRKDQGVPAYLVKTGEKGGVVSLAFVEVRDDANDPGGYAASFGADRLPFDYVWFTPRVDDDDPCVKFAKQLEQMKQRP